MSHGRFCQVMRYKKKINIFLFLRRLKIFPRRNSNQNFFGVQLIIDDKVSNGNGTWRLIIYRCRYNNREFQLITDEKVTWFPASDSIKSFLIGSVSYDLSSQILSANDVTLDVKLDYRLCCYGDEAYIDNTAQAGESNQLLTAMEKLVCETKRIYSNVKAMRKNLAPSVFGFD